MMPVPTPEVAPIVAQSGMQVSIWTAALWTASASLISGIGATLMSRNLKLAEFRQDWINDMRAEIADYFVACDEYYTACAIYRSGGASHDAPLTLPEAQKAVATAKAKADSFFYRITLRINPTHNENESDDAAFLASLALLVVDEERQLSVTDKDREKHFQDAMRQSRMLLKREWEVVKGMRPIRSWCRRLAFAMKQADSSINH